MTLDPQNVRDAADLLADEYGPARAIELLQARMPKATGQEMNAVLEAIGHVRRHYDTGEKLGAVEAAK